MLSPVLFISGPSFLFTLGNLLKEKTGSLIAYPVYVGLKSKSYTLFSPSITFVA